MALAKSLSAQKQVNQLKFIGTSVLVHLGIFGVLAISFGLSPEFGTGLSNGGDLDIDVYMEESVFPSDTRPHAPVITRQETLISESDAISERPTPVTNTPTPPSASISISEQHLAAESSGSGQSSGPAATGTSRSDGNGGPGMTSSTKANPSYLSNPSPIYPDSAKRRGEEGTVILYVNVDKNGYAALVSLSKSSGFKALDESAIKTVKRWKFKPATFAGIPISSTAEVPITFRLNR